LGDRKGIRPVKKLGVGLLVVMIRLELQVPPPLPSSLASMKLANPHSPGKLLLKWREKIITLNGHCIVLSCPVIIPCLFYFHYFHYIVQFYFYILLLLLELWRLCAMANDIRFDSVQLFVIDNGKLTRFFTSSVTVIVHVTLSD